MSGARLDNAAAHDRQEEEEEDEEVSDNPLPAWMEGDSLAPPCQADMDVVRAIIDFAGVTQDDVLYDLGCGDGRICIEAAESRGARACGVEIEEDLADKFRRRVTARGLESKVAVVHGDLRDVDLSDATVVVMYLLPEAVAGLAQSHLLPLLRRGQSAAPPTEHDGATAADVLGDEVLLSRRGQEGVVAEEQRAESRNVQGDAAAGEDYSLARGEGREEDWRSRSGSGVGSGGTTPCRIVCNTWGIPGATAVREAGVGLHGGVKLRLFTHASLPDVA